MEYLADKEPYISLGSGKWKVKSGVIQVVRNTTTNNDNGVVFVVFANGLKR